MTGTPPVLPQPLSPSNPYQGCRPRIPRGPLAPRPSQPRLHRVRSLRSAHDQVRPAAGHGLYCHATFRVPTAVLQWGRGEKGALEGRDQGVPVCGVRGTDGEGGDRFRRAVWGVSGKDSGAEALEVIE